MANDEFVDLDDIVPGTGFKKKQEEYSSKKEVKEVPSKTQEPTPKAQDKPTEKKPEIEEYTDEIEEETIDEEQSEEETKPKTKSQKTSKEELIQDKKPKELKPRQEIKEQKETKQEISKKESPVAAFLKTEKLGEKQIKKKEQKPVQKDKFSNASKLEEKQKKSILHRKKKAHEKQSKKEVLPVAKFSKKEKREKQDDKGTNWTLIALLILGVIVIGIIVYMALYFDFAGSEQESVVAVVNGQPIYKSELVNRHNLLKSTMDPFITEAQVLNLTITDELLVQEATKRKITTSDEEVKELLDSIMIQNGIEEATLKQDLESKNVSYEYLFKLYKDTLTINKLINESLRNLSLSDEEISLFYEQNKESLKIPDMVQVRHILVMFGTSENETYVQAKTIADKIKEDKSNFCDLVVEYTEDAGSKNICGEYNFSSDFPFVPEFLEAGFSMKPGEIRIVKTQIGYHIMYKVADLPGYVPEFNNIKERLIPIITEDKTVKSLQELISSLQDGAIIEIYNDSVSTKRFKEITINNQPTEEEVPTIEISDPVNQETQNAEVNVEIVSNEEVQTEVQIDSVPEVTKQVVETPSSKKYLLAKCLTDEGDRVFLAAWSPDSQAQLALFEEYSSNLITVECDPESKEANLEECSSVLKKQYPTWPTWEIKGTLYEGIQSLAALSKYSGCSY